MSNINDKIVSFYEETNSSIKIIHKISKRTSNGKELYKCKCICKRYLYVTEKELENKKYDKCRCNFNLVTNF